MIIHLKRRGIAPLAILVLLLASSTGGAAIASEFTDMCAKSTGAAADDKMCACLDIKAAGQTRADLVAYFTAIVAVSNGAPPLDPAAPVSKAGQAALAGDTAMDCAMASVK